MSDIDESTPASEAPSTAEARSTERERIKTILTSDEVKGREDLARHLAFETGESAEAAIALLSQSPRATSGRTPLAVAMEAVGTPGIRSFEADHDTGAGRQVSAPAVYARLNDKTKH